jgi:membrane-associated protease RseP (regulator of RpoE activity)
MHFVLAVVLTFAALAVGGDLIHDPGATTKVAQIVACTNPAEDGSCPRGATPAPAAAAGLRVGDDIVGVNGVAVTSWPGLVQTIQDSPGEALRLTVRRNGVNIDLPVTPAVTTAIADDGTRHKVGFLGVSPEPKGYPQYTVVAAAAHTPQVLWAYVTGTVSALGKFPGQIPNLVNGKPRSPDGPAGVVDITRIGGSIASAPETLGSKAGALLLIGASVNFFVGVFNLLPLLPLDGGHIAILGYENLRAWFARRRGRTDPGRVNLLKVLPVAYVVVAAFVGLSLLLVYAGIFNPIQGA